MDKDTLDYLDQKWFSLATKEDLEKVRQEMKSNFRQLKEENRAQTLEWGQDLKTGFEQFIKESKVDVAPFIAVMEEGLERLRTETQSSLEQTNQKLEFSLHQSGEKAEAAFGQSSRETRDLLQSMREEEKKIFENEAEETRKEMDQLKGGVERMDERINQLMEGLTAISGKIGDRFRETREELGAMIKFSSADLEKKINALEARIKALEKIVFP